MYNSQINNKLTFVRNHRNPVRCFLISPFSFGVQLTTDSLDEHSVLGSLIHERQVPGGLCQTVSNGCLSVSVEGWMNLANLATDCLMFNVFWVMINSHCKKGEFVVFKAINADKGVYEVKWGYEPMMERVMKLNEETGEYEWTGEMQDTSFCRYAVERFYSKPSVHSLNSVMDNSKRYVLMSEIKTIAESIGLDEIQTVNWMKERMKKNIALYDKSKDVENFTINGVDVWLDKETRTGLLLRFQAEKAAGKSDTTLWYNGVMFGLKVDDAIGMLYALEVYASASYDRTQAVTAEVDGMSGMDEFLLFDFRTGYPAQLAF